MKKLMTVILALVMLLSLTACGGNGGSTQGSSAAVQLNMPEVYTAITKDVEMPEMMQLENSMLLDLYGIRDEYCNQAVVYICVNSLRADEIWLLEAKDAAAMETLKTLAQNRLDQKDAESITYSPEQNKIVKAAEVIEAGNYLVMIVSPNAAAIAEAFRAEAGI